MGQWMRDAGGEDGSTVVMAVATIAASMLVFVLLANALVVLYGRGVVRAALDEGVRAGANVGAGAEECQRRAEDAVADLLGGALGDGVTLACEETPERITAQADAVFQGWLPGVPAWHFQLGADSTREPALEQP